MLCSVHVEDVIKHFAVSKVKKRDFLNCVLHCNSKCMQNTHRTGICVKTVFGRPFVKRFALCYQTVVLYKCPVCDVGVYCGQTVGWIKTKLACR